MGAAGLRAFVLGVVLAMLASATPVAAQDGACTQATVEACDLPGRALPEMPVESLDVDTALPAPTPDAVAESPAAEPGQDIDLAGYAPGTIVVKTSQRRLYLVLADGEKLSYPVGVGKAGKSWSGTGFIRGKFLKPAWSPPKAMKREKPHLPDYIPGGVPANPMGAAAMTLNVDQYAIHGTNHPASIGGSMSFGCIRMHNRDILDLYKRVKIGTRVVVLN